MASPDDVAKAFVVHYYQTFDQNRANLAGLYRNESMLTYEGKKFQGTGNIVKHYVELPMTTVQHKINTVDPQPSPGNGLIIFVSGFIKVDNGEHEMPFSQVFNLQPIPGQGGLYVLNDMFRLNLG